MTIVLAQATLRGQEQGVRARASRIRDQEPGSATDTILAVVGEGRAEGHLAIGLERAGRRKADAVRERLEVEPRDPKPSDPRVLALVRGNVDVVQLKSWQPAGRRGQEPHPGFGRVPK